MNQTERVLREELRGVLMTSLPEALPPKPPYDLEAERTLIASMWDPTIEVPAYLLAEHFFAPLHGHLFTFLIEVRARVEVPTVDLAITWLDQQGYRASGLARAVEEVAEHVPSVVPLVPVAQRLVILARRRAALLAASRFIILLRDLNSTDEELKTEFKRAWNALRGALS